MQFRFVPEAETELAEARIWYGLQRDGLDVELMQRIDETLQRISNAPRRYPRVHRQLRRAIVKQFPFGIFYEVTTDEILVFAVFHSRRDPKQLTSRLKHLSNSEWP
jgi:plasmid stabilization system protein ParE